MKTMCKKSYDGDKTIWYTERKFGGKSFALMCVHAKKQTDNLSKDFKKLGYYIRITKVKDGHALWVRK